MIKIFARHRYSWLWLALFVLFCNKPIASKEPLVLVSELDSTIVIDLKYATPENFTGKVLYDTTLCYLRKSVAERLVRVQKRLREKGLGLKIWDGYRPLSVQWKMWELVKDPRYVADPHKGSRHNRGAAVDLTLVDSLGNELPMPTGFDDFTAKASRKYKNLPAEVLRNREMLTEAMKAEGFIPLPSEWWHFDAPNWQDYSLLDIPLTKVKQEEQSEG